MDAQATQAATDIGSLLLKLSLGVMIAIIGAVLWDMNDRLKRVEAREILTKDDVKDAVKAVLHDDDTTRRRR